MTTLLIRRIRNVEGDLVTYLPSREIQSVVGVAASTLSHWAEMGLVRVLPAVGKHGRGYSVVDAARLKLMSVKESQALGLQRTPARYLVSQKAYVEHENELTLARAAYHRERWDDKDEEFLISAFEEGRSVESIALMLGRTYAAVLIRIQRLREQGTEPAYRRNHNDDSWQERVAAVLTDEELDLLTGAE